jgi:predicted O-linked N-acetylglucosamine transferase (SPINDLY family)
MGYSFLTAVGISEGIAKNWEEYIDWGVKLGTNLDLRLQLQQKLVQSKRKETLSPIWNPQKFALDAYTLFQTLEKKFVQEALLPIVNPPISEAAKLKFEEGKSRVKEQDLDRAVICFREAIALQPDYVAAYNQLGNALQTLEQSDEAIAAYQKILEINPNVAAAHCNLGSIWQMQEKFEEAIAAYQRAIQLKPDFALAHSNLGGLLASQRRFVEAETYLSQALQLQPQTVELHQQLGNILRQVGKIEEGMICFRNAIKLNPQSAEAFHNLGCLLMTKGQIDAARKCFEKVLKLQPDSPTIHPNLGFILEVQGQYPEALIAYDRALALNPEATELLYQREHLRLILCDWEDFDVRMQTLTERIQEHICDPRSARLPPLSLSCFPIPTELHQAVNRHWSQSITESMADLKARCGFEHQHNQERNSTNKIRLGYLSADFRSHAVGCLIADIFQYHDRHVFEVHAYSLTDTEDEITKIIRDGCDFFVNIAVLSVEAAARRIYEDRIDILIDLAGYTTFCRPEILALQPAPIQIQYLGYPDTMAAEFIQYILSDRWVIPPDLAHHYTEQVLELSQMFIASPVEILDNAPTRQELGLPEQGFVYCCFNRTDKFDPHLFAIWMRILQEVPESVLWLIEVTPEINVTLRKEALAKGVDPQRLVFSPRFSMSEFIAIAQRADLFLDTFNYNAGATAICGLQSGLPILTYTGETFTSRMAASICASVGLETFICDSPLVYEQQAIYWGKHPQELGLIRTKLLESKQNLPLFQPKQWIKNLEFILKNLSQQFTTPNSSSSVLRLRPKF